MTTPLFTSDTPVGGALRLRPRLAEHLAAFGAEPWENPAVTLGALFRNPAALDRFLRIAATLPVAVAGPDWMDRPASHLADHLTQDHRDFLLVTVPDIAGRFRDWDSLDPEITDRRDEFEAFADALRRETDAEESLLFPRILHAEALLRDPVAGPERAVSVPKAEAAFRTARVAGARTAELARIAARLREAHAVRQGDARGETLAARLEDFHERVAAHERLGDEVLRPMAAELEKALRALALPVRAGGREVGAAA